MAGLSQKKQRPPLHHEGAGVLETVNLSGGKADGLILLVD
jgi:hypothetical protein